MDSYYPRSSTYYYPHNMYLSHESASQYAPETYAENYYGYSSVALTPEQSSPSSYYYANYGGPTSPTGNVYNPITSTPCQSTSYSTTPASVSPSSFAVVQKPLVNPSLNSTFDHSSAPPAGRRRRQRTIFTKDQVDILDQVFEKNQYPDIQLREQLSERLDVPEARIQVWFKNRRSRARTSTKSKYPIDGCF